MNNAPNKSAIANIVLGLGCLAFAAFLYLGALHVPPPIFDPLGSAAVPKVAAIVIALLSVVILMSGLRQRSTPAVDTSSDGNADAAEDEELPVAPRYDLGVCLLGFCAAYVAGMEFGVLGYSLATAVFLLASGLLLGGLNARNVLLSLIISVVVGFGSDLIFSEFFYIQLPR
jgi:putative tricarboxylic transport membrane protein